MAMTIPTTASTTTMMAAKTAQTFVALIRLDERDRGSGMRPFSKPRKGVWGDVGLRIIMYFSIRSMGFLYDACV
jgi:hypothetical protein